MLRENKHNRKNRTNFRKLGILDFFENFTEVNMRKVNLKGVALRIKDYVVIKVVQTTLQIAGRS